MYIKNALPSIIFHERIFSLTFQFESDIRQAMKKIVCTLFLILTALTAQAQEPKCSWSDHLSSLWHSDQYDFVLPANTWHNRLAYSHQKIKEFNERPWGAGIGKRFYDEDKDLHSMIAMVFLDSHDDPEPLIGYQFQKKWYYGEQQDFSLGLGYSMGITARSDYSWVPFPYVAPIFSIQYWRISLENTYIPGKKGNGNVLFTWLRIEI